MKYTPTAVELGVTAGIWVMGMFVFTMLARVAIAVETGELKAPTR